MAASRKPARVKQVTANAARALRKPKTTTTKVNSAERTAEVETFKAARPKAPNRENMIAWAATNPNMKSNAARNLAKSRAPKSPKAPK
jgi:hypothetical protein